MTDYNLFAQATPGGTISSGAGSAGTNGLHFTVSTACTLDGIWHWSSSSDTQLPTSIGLYTTQASPSTGTLVTSNTATWLTGPGGSAASAGSGWCYAAFTSPPSLSSGTDYMATQYRNDAANRWFSYYSVTWPVTSGILTAPMDKSTSALSQGWYNTATPGSMTFPATQSGTAGHNFGMDVQVTTSSGAGATLTTPNLALAAPLVTPSAGATVALTTPNLALGAPLVTPVTGVSVALTTPNLALAAPLVTPSAGATVALTTPNLALAAPAVTPPAGTVPVVKGSWTGSYAIPSGYTFPFPGARPLQIGAANTAGDWLFALVTWRPLSTAGSVSVCVADDAHNWWEPVGNPNTDSSASGTVRVALWAAPAARVTPGGTTNVQVAPTGPVAALAALIVDMSGLLPWMQVAAIVTNFANAASSLALSASAPSARALLFSLTGSDNNSDTVTGPSGWTALTTVSASNGVDHTADIKLTPAYQVTSAASSSSVTSSGSLDLAGAIAGVIVSAAAPAQSNTHWPVTVTEAAVGAGVGTPPSQLTWTDMSARTLALSVKQGKQYTLGSLSAGQGTLTVDNQDGAFLPPGSGAFAGIDSGTPLRRRIIIPQISTPHYVMFNGFLRRLPWQMDPELYRGMTTAEVVDIWAYAAQALNSMAIEECLIDSPYALWPATDPAGAASASNIAPGNSLPLTQVTSKYGSGTATAVFGANSGQLVGASSATVTSSGTGGGSSGMWSQALAGNSLAYNGYGYCLSCTDTGYPSLTGGVTVETWASCTLTPDLTAISGNGECLVSAAGGTFNTAQSNFPNGMPIKLGVLGTSALPGGFSAGTYYVTGADGSGNYSLSSTQGGSAISPTSGGVGTVAPFILWDPVILSLRDGNGTVTGLSIRQSDGALLLLQRNGTSVTATAVDTGHDYRSGIWHFSLAATKTAWRVLVNAGGQLSTSGTFSPSLPASFRLASLAGVQDAVSQGYALPGAIGFPVIIPGFSPQQRVLNRYWASGAGMIQEAACDRVERILEYAGLAGRRWLGQQQVTYEGDLCASGRDIGGQAAASSAGSIAQSTLPAQLFIAPTGDVFYLAKLYTWNQPVKWTLGDNAAGGEIPFLPTVATDYDPTRVSSPVQVTSLDTQGVTVASGVTSSSTMAAVTAAAAGQYGGQPYQSTSYLDYDYSSAYGAGGSSVDLANWVANIYRKPANRVQALTVEAAANSANLSSQQAWAFFAGASAGDMVQVNVRLPTVTTSPLISLTARITQTQRSSSFDQSGTSAKISVVLDFAPEYSALTCDDAVRGLLNGSNCLSW